jgi:formyltetrahydrofolate-dependent phosphoribosylglycinamide formyltransferase
VSVRLAVFASGGGSNLQALLNRFADAPHVRIALVVSDRAESGALRRARAAGVEAVHIPVSGRAAADVARDTLDALARMSIDLLALAGYLRLIPPAVVEKYRGRILNIHPALLPAFGGPGMYGLRVHEAVLDAGCRVSGATVHYVDERYDEGRIIAQWPVPVLPADTAATLAARVLSVEHRLYPAVIDAIARAGAGGSAGAGESARAVAAERAALAGEAFHLGGDAPPPDHHIVAIARI